MKIIGESYFKRKLVEWWVHVIMIDFTSVVWNRFSDILACQCKWHVISNSRWALALSTLRDNTK